LHIDRHLASPVQTSGIRALSNTTHIHRRLASAVQTSGIRTLSYTRHVLQGPRTLMILHK